MGSLLRMRSCCLCLDTGKGTILTAVACIAASVVTFVLILLGLIYWDTFSEEVRKAYNETGVFSDDEVGTILSVVWWGNIFSLIVAIIYIILCCFLILGVARETYKHMIPWISASSMLIPFFLISFIIQLIFGLVRGPVLPVLVPAILVIVWCIFWGYGFFCAVSHYRMLKGDIHRPVATIFKRAPPEREYR